MQWSSKQHGDSALMLFGDRINTAQLAVMIESESVQGSEAVIEAIEAEADQLGVVLIADSRDELPVISDVDMYACPESIKFAVS